MTSKQQHYTRTPSRRSLLSLLNPASYVPHKDGAIKHEGGIAGTMGERAGNVSPTDLKDGQKDGLTAGAVENSSKRMNITLPPGAHHTTAPQPVPFEHDPSAESKDSTSTKNTMLFAPPLPPKFSTSSTNEQSTPKPSSVHRPSLTDRKPTTQVSTLDIQTLTFPDGTRGTFSSTDNTSSPSKGTSLLDYISRKSSRGTVSKDEGPVDDVASIASLTPSSIHTRRLPSGLISPESIFSGFGAVAGSNSADLTPAQRLLSLQSSPTLPPFLDDIPFTLCNFPSELQNLPEIERNPITHESNEEVVLQQFRSKQKQYFVLSSSGKPIWSRHGDINLINGYIGVISTIISSFAGFNCPLHSFSAGATLFVITNPGRGPLYFVGISRVDGEGVTQIEKQLDSLYQQILSTLTLPRLVQTFKHRPGTDLSRSLEGTEKLLSSLCDTFASGSPSSLLSSLECLRMRKTHRQIISNTLLQHKTEKLLYGLLVAGGKLVSVLRPKQHSLHPGDLELIFNMLFPNGKKVGGEGENWVPVCLPGFNDGGYLYLYVSFLPLIEVQGHRKGASNAGTPQSRRGENTESFGSRLSTASTTDSPRSSFVQDASSTPRLASADTPLNDDDVKDEVAILLISPDREAFFEMKEMRDALVKSLVKNGSLQHISRAVRLGRPSIPQLLMPTMTARERGTGDDKVAMRHFMYKSRADVQFVQSKVDWGSHPDDPEFEDPELTSAKSLVKHRRLMSIYAGLHCSLHSRHTHPRIIWSVQEEFVALAWITPVYEFYCVAGRAERTDLASDETGTLKEKRREEEKEIERQKAQLSKEAERVIKWVEKEMERVFILGGAVF